MTGEELLNCRFVNHLTCKPEELVDLKTIPVAADLPIVARMEQYLNHVKNPYLFRIDDLIVKVSFCGKRDLHTVLADWMMQS